MDHINVTAMNNSWDRLQSYEVWCMTNHSCYWVPVITALLSIFSLVGATGNALVLYVFGKRKEKLTSTLFILALAGTDFITCVLIMPYTIVFESLYLNVKYDLVCKCIWFLLTSNVPCSSFIMVAIAVDRYFCICHPFLHAITLKRAKIIIFCLVMFAMSLGVFTALCHGVHREEPPPNHLSESLMYSTHLVNGTVAYTQMKVIARTTDAPTDAPTDEPGLCIPTTALISEHVRKTFRKFYASLYLLAVLVVSVLYLLIYRSVRMRRAVRLRQKAHNTTLTIPEPSCEETQLTVLNGNGVTDTEASELANKQKKKRQHISKREKNRVANLKTAAMLFVVTVVFIVLFLPAWLMAHKVVRFNVIVFYMYFLYNVVNPIIYSFMNESFREDLRILFRCKR